MKNLYSLIILFVSVFFALLWYFDVISEPLFAIISGFVAIALFLLSKNGDVKNQDKTENVNITQNHSGLGDNIARDKNLYSDDSKA